MLYTTDLLFLYNRHTIHAGVYRDTCFSFTPWNIAFTLHMSVMASEITGNWIVFNDLLQLTTEETSNLRIIDHLWEESTSDQWIPLTKGQ